VALLTEEGLGDSGGMPEIPGLEGTEMSSRINVTPMIDVMLVLLIIFMVVTPLMAEYEATPPRAAMAQGSPDDDVVTLAIDRSGAYWLENQRLPPGSLDARLQAAYASRPDDGLLMLEADRNVDYARVLDAIEAARGVGVETIGAVARPGEGEADEADGEASSAAEVS
jgi:biopolymer transport protein ExbD